MTSSPFLWHPFTQHQTEAPPLRMVRGKGAYLYDEQGKQYIDAISSWWTTLHGHSHPRLNDALQKQAQCLEHTMFSGFTHPPAEQLAEKLIHSLRPPFEHPENQALKRVFYSDNGSTAVEVALKIAFQFFHNHGEHRPHFIAFEGGYHGDTFGAMAMGRGSGFFKTFEPLLGPVHLIPFPETWKEDSSIEEKEENALAVLEKVLEIHGQKISALIMEPLLQGAGGMRMCRPEFIQRLVQCVRKHGILIIFDEVAVGFGRLGALFAFHLCHVIPDMICLAKGLSGGYMPLSATVCSEKIFNAFLGKDFSRALAHGHSYTANPLACAVGSASLDLFEEEKTFEKIARISDIYHEYAASLCLSKHVRWRGSIFAMGKKEGYKSARDEQFRLQGREKGYNLRALGGNFYIFPPYCIEEQDLKNVLEFVISYDEKR